MRTQISPSGSPEGKLLSLLPPPSLFPLPPTHAPAHLLLKIWGGGVWSETGPEEADILDSPLPLLPKTPLFLQSTPQSPTKLFVVFPLQTISLPVGVWQTLNRSYFLCSLHSLTPPLNSLSSCPTLSHSRAQVASPIFFL